MNIDVFIMTKNRATYLEQSIKSVLAQTYKVSKITILDNESEDCTEHIANMYKQCKYVKTYGFLGNFNKARELVNSDYVMLYHDDDILNPHYFTLADKLIKKHNPAMITTKYTRFFNDETPQIKEPNSNYYLFNTQKELVRYMIGVEGVAYAPAIYKTSAFLSEELEYKKYGKFNDWVFMAKMGKHGKTIITRDENMHYVRIHPQQDTRNPATALIGQQIINWDKYFYEILGEDILTSKSYHFLKSKYDQFTTKDFKRQVSFEQLRQDFIKQCPNVNQSYNKPLLETLAINIAKENLCT